MHVFQTELWLPRKRAEIFDFFSDAGNLEVITPEWLNFHIITPRPFVMTTGTIIDYRLRLRGFPLKWRSRITVWEPPFRFVDEQLRGPYRHWHHTHTFEEKDGGTLCRDTIEYSVLGGSLVNTLFVKRDVQRIFCYRSCVLKKRFG